MSPSIHQHLSEHLRCIGLQHESGVEERDRLKSDGETSAVSKERDVDLGELDIELPEVVDVVSKQSVTQVTLDQLILQSVLLGSENELKGVKSNLILLDIAIHEDKRLYPVVNAVADEVILKKKLFTKDKSKVSLTEQSVQETIIALHQLILNVLQDGSYLSEWEQVKVVSCLFTSVHLVIESEILHVRHHTFVLNWSSELSEDDVAGVHDELEISPSTLLIEDENKLVVEAKPINQLKYGSE